MEIGKNILENLDKLKEGRELNHSEILDYLSAHTSKFWSWGADGFTKMTNSALRFKVNGHHHKGHVYIFLNFMDTFDVYLTTTKGEIKQIFNEVYIDELFNLLDEKIEKISAYELPNHDKVDDVGFYVKRIDQCLTLTDARFVPKPVNVFF